MKKSALTIRLMLMFLICACITAVSSADTYTDLVYGGDGEILSQSGKSVVIEDAGMEKEWLDKTTSIIFFIYCEGGSASGTVSFRDLYGEHTREWQVSSSGYSCDNGEYGVQTGSLSEGYAYVPVYVESLQSPGDGNTGVTFSINSISGGTVSLDCVGFYVYSGSGSQARFVGTLSHIKQINSVWITGSSASILDAGKQPEFNYGVAAASENDVTLIDEIRTNINDSSDVVSKSAAANGNNRNYTWGAKYRLSFVFEAKEGRRFTNGDFALYREGIDYSFYISSEASEDGKRMTVTFSDSTAPYAKKKAEKINLSSIYLTLTAGKEPTYTGFATVDGQRVDGLVQSWIRKTGGTPLISAAEDGEYFYVGELPEGDLFYYDGLPQVLVNGNELSLYTLSGFKSNAELDGSKLIVRIEGFKVGNGSSASADIGDNSQNAGGSSSTNGGTANNTGDGSPNAGERTDILAICFYLAVFSFFGMIVSLKFGGRREGR